MATTDQLLEAERADARDLKQLAKNMEDVRETTLWGLLLELMQDDTSKHIKILQFIPIAPNTPRLGRGRKATTWCWGGGGEGGCKPPLASLSPASCGE